MQNNQEKICTIISKSPKYLKLPKIIEDFFKNEAKDIGTDKLMNLLFIFEHLCYENLSKNNIQKDFILEIPEDIKEKIKEKLIKNFNNKLFTIKDLGAAVRRYISRYVIGLTQRADVDNTRKLYYQLTREELWENRISKEKNFEQIIMDEIKEFDLNAGQAVNFYDLIGDEDKNELKFLEENN